MRYLPCFMLTLVSWCFAACPAHAWLSEGHRKATRVAMTALQGSDLPLFFEAATETIAREATLPDAMRNPATPVLHSAERSEHFFDLELIGGNELPATRASFIAMCQDLKLRPEQVGYLPYAVVENTQRLAVAFADYRRHPEDKAIQARCVVIAGQLAHYAQDMAQPLHVTIHFDGRLPAGTIPEIPAKPGTGIHKRMDALLERVDVEPGPFDMDRLPMIAVKDLAISLQMSNAMVDRVYLLEADLPTDKPTWQPTPEVRSFATERLRQAAFLTSMCFLTAWDISATIQLPAWLDGPATTAPAPTTAPAETPEVPKATEGSK